MATDQTIHYIRPSAAPGRGRQVDENLVIYFMWPYMGRLSRLPRESGYARLSLCRDGADTPIVRVHRKASVSRTLAF